jgi:hypothetical protein
MALRDIRGGQVRLRDLPDLPPLKRETEKYAEMAAELDAARRKIRELEALRPKAKQADRDKFAKVILAKGAKAPDQPGTEQARLEQEIAKAQTRRDACETALDVAETNLIEAVNAKRSELLRDVDQGVEKIERDFAAAAEKLIALRAQRDDAANLRAWVAGFPDQLIELRKTSRPFYGVKTMNGSPLSGAAFVEALREDVSPTEPVRVPVPAESLEGVDRFAAA